MSSRRPASPNYFAEHSIICICPEVADQAVLDRLDVIYDAVAEGRDVDAALIAHGWKGVQDGD